jgi:hypothetical protein
MSGHSKRSPDGLLLFLTYPSPSEVYRTASQNSTAHTTQRPSNRANSLAVSTMKSPQWPLILSSELANIGWTVIYCEVTF